MTKDVTFAIEMTVVECPECHTIFAVLNMTYKRWRDKNISRIHCPFGHSMVPGYNSAINRLERQAEQLSRTIVSSEACAEQLRKQRDKAKKQAAAYKGHTKRYKTCACSGECPFCKRNFRNVKRHMQAMHPSLLKEAT